MDKIRTYLIGAVILLAACVSCFVGGRFSAPTKTVTVDHTAELDQARERIRDLTVKLENTKTDTKTETVIVYRDGKPAEKHVTQATHTDASVSTHTDTKTTAAHTETHVETKSVTTEHPTPKWFAGPMFVVIPGSIPQTSAGIVIGHTLPKVFFLPPLALGVSFTVPLNKPVSLPAIGVSLTASF